MKCIAIVKDRTCSRNPIISQSRWDYCFLHYKMYVDTERKPTSPEQIELFNRFGLRPPPTVKGNVAKAGHWRHYPSDIGYSSCNVCRQDAGDAK